METEPRGSRPVRGWLVVLIVLLVIAAIAAAIFFAMTVLLRQMAAQVISPVTDANQHVQTQMAQLLHPTPTILPDPITIVRDVRSLARLETIQYTLEKVVTAETNQGELAVLFGDKLLFVAHGKVIAGVDLSLLKPQDIRVEGEVLYVTLPPAEVFSATLDNDKSYVYDRQTGLLTRPGVNLETEARAAAEKEILQAAIDDGILAQAQQNAESYLTRLFESMGYQDVEFITPTPTPGPSPTP